MTSRRIGTADAFTYLLVLMLVAASGVVSYAFLPWRVGSLLLPVSALVSAVVLWWAAHAGYRLFSSLLAAALPVALWLTVVLYLAFSRHFGYIMVLTDWRSPFLLGVGFLSAAIALGTLWGDRTVARIAAQRAASGASARGDGSEDPASGSAVIDVPEGGSVAVSTPGTGVTPVPGQSGHVPR